MKRTIITNLAEYWLFRAMLWKLRLLPYKWSRDILTFLFSGVGLSLGIRRSVAQRQLKSVFPDLDAEQLRQLVRKVYYNMGLTVAENYLLPEKRLIASSTLQGRENLDKALALGRGAILATAHFGNWETARILPLKGIPVGVVVKKQHNPYFDRYNNALRTRHGVTIIDFRSGLRAILKHLNRNEVVAILADQKAGAKGLTLDFMGYPASHWIGVAKLSLRYQVPIVPGFALRTPQGNTKFCFEPMIYHPELEDQDQNYPFILRKLNAVLETYIYKYPEQWFWVHKRWSANSSQPCGNVREVLD